MLLWLRNGARDFDYTLSDSWYDPPSTGPKHALLVVDSHFWPMSWDSYRYSSGANLRITSRCQPANATFTLQETTPFTLRLGYNPATGEYLDEPTETKTFEPLPAVSQFHDSMGYYPGLWYRPSHRRSVLLAGRGQRGSACSGQLLHPDHLAGSNSAHRSLRI